MVFHARKKKEDGCPRGTWANPFFFFWNGFHTRKKMVVLEELGPTLFVFFFFFFWMGNGWGALVVFSVFFSIY
jgi:hypothetical protein